jgi:hypothetical protein
MMKAARCGAVLAVAAGAIVATTGSAHAAETVRGAAHAVAGAPRAYSYSAPQPGYTITFVARECAKYSDVMANGARNNIMETLQDLGKDSVYTRGQPIDPSIEEPNDPDCTPLNGWQFEMGSGYAKPNQQLSVISGSPKVITGDTTSGVDWLNPDGTPSGKKLDGALIYKLTDEQFQLAQRSALWVQGGTVANPQLENRYGDKYGFASLRCAVDNWNADNVEYVAYPSGYRNMFCYAYYVSPAPTPGTVTITKKVTGTGVSQGFTFESNLSYNPNGTFPLILVNGTSASADFIRANSTAFGGPYDVKEQVPNGWKLDSITCSRLGFPAVPSTWVIDKSTASVAITLSGHDHVTCVYTDSPPLAPTLVVWKVTGGRAGGPFTFAVRGRVDHDLTATTTAAEQPEEATENGTSPTDYEPGTYTITEQMPPAADYGHWRFDHAYCNGHPLRSPTRGARADSPVVTVNLEQNVGQDCFFRNTFVPDGRIILRVKTIGGTGAGWFYINSPSSPKPAPHHVTTVRDSEEIVAYDQGGLPLEHYNVQTTGPLADPTKGSWELVSFGCTEGDVTVNYRQNITIKLTDSKPKADCLVVYKYVPATTVDVVKTATGAQAARSGPAVVDIGCADQASGRVVLDENSAHATLPEPLYLHKDVTCTVSEPRTGAKAPENWKVKATVNGSKLSLPGTFDVSGSGSKTYTVEVTNHYRPAKIPGSLPGGRLRKQVTGDTVVL